MIPHVALQLRLRHEGGHGVDHDQIHRGAVAFWRAGPLVPMVLAYSVIAVGFTGYAASRPVLFSGRMTNRDQVGQRLLESFRYIAKAYTPGGMQRFEDGFKHTARVRMIHATVRHVLSRSPEWDWEDWGTPINNLAGIQVAGVAEGPINGEIFLTQDDED